MYTTEQVATLLGTTRAAIYCRRNRCPETLPPAVRMGRRLLWDERDVAEWQEQNKEKTGREERRIA